MIGDCGAQFDEGDLASPSHPPKVVSCGADNWGDGGIAKLPKRVGSSSRLEFSILAGDNRRNSLAKGSGDASCLSLRHWANFFPCPPLILIRFFANVGLWHSFNLG